MTLALLIIRQFALTRVCVVATYLGQQAADVAKLCGFGEHVDTSHEPFYI
jgi:hypothetical protein